MSFYDLLYVDGATSRTIRPVGRGCPDQALKPHHFKEDQKGMANNGTSKRNSNTGKSGIQRGGSKGASQSGTDGAGEIKLILKGIQQS